MIRLGNSCSWFSSINFSALLGHADPCAQNDSSDAVVGSAKSARATGKNTGITDSHPSCCSNPQRSCELVSRECSSCVREWLFTTALSKVFQDSEVAVPYIWASCNMWNNYLSDACSSDNLNAMASSGTNNA